MNSVIRIKNLVTMLVLVCTCLFAAAMQAASIAVMSDWFGGMLGFAVAVMSLWCILGYLSRIGVLKSSTAEAFAIMGLCLAVQLLLIGMLPAMRQNGMAAAWDSRAALRAIQSGKICFTHNVRHQYWCNYEILLSALGNVFSPKLSVGQTLNALFCASVVFPLFKLSERVAGRGIARFASLLIGFSPAVMLYSTMLTSEFISAALLFYGFYFLCDFLRRTDFRQAACPALLSGIFVGLSHLFKPITVLFMAALALVLFVAWLRCPRRTEALRIFILGIVVFVSSLAVRTVGQSSFAAFVDEPKIIDACDQSSTLLYELVLGLNVPTDGIYSSDLAMKFVGMDEAQRRRFAADVVKRDWRKYPGLMVRKFLNLHGSHLRPGGAVASFALSFRDWPLVRGGQTFMPSWVRPFTDSGTMLFRFAFLLGAVGLLVFRKREADVFVPGLFSAALVLAFAAVEQLIEGHGRYKVAIYPFYFMVVPYACVWFKRDNPVYVRIGELVRKIRDRMASNGH